MPTNSDTILDILGNDTRRKILSVLSKEPMYFNQLAKQIDIGQQAMLRHLQALQDAGIIETYSEKSNLGAPKRKYYKLNSSFTLTISFSNDDFTIINQDIKESRQTESEKYYRRYDSMSEDEGKALTQLRDNLAGVEQEIARLESRLSDLRALRQMTLRRLHEIGIDNFEIDERNVLYIIVRESPKSVADLSIILDEKESHLRVMIKSMRNKLEQDNEMLGIFDDLE